MFKIGVLASGRGSNFQAIIDAVEKKKIDVEISILISDQPEAMALERAVDHNIKILIIERKNYDNNTDYNAAISNALKAEGVDLVVLAGYMRIVREPILSDFKNKIINIHPALLPSFPGLDAQKQAFDYGVKYTGCTVHFVDSGVDTGAIILQEAVPVYNNDTRDSVAERILQQEHKLLPKAIGLISKGLIEVYGRKTIISE